MTNNKVIAGIVLFNPSISRLIDNINGIINQVDKVLLVDNASDNLNEVKDAVQNDSKIVFIEEDTNKGIAYALNEIIDYAYENGYEWALTLDQDSVCMDHLIENYFNCISNEHTNIGIVTCKIKDRNVASEIGGEMKTGWASIPYCITSGSLMNVRAVKRIEGGYDNKLFIDKVDLDICLNMTRRGYLIYRVNYEGLLHELGHATNVKTFWGKNEVLLWHSAQRRYYMLRNGIYLIRKYKAYMPFRFFLTDLYIIFLNLLYEDKKWERFSYSVKGIFDGFRL